MKAILTDIEGTTTALDFVKKTLFPYAEAHMDRFIHENQSHPEVAQALFEIEGSLEQKIEQLHRWMQEDQKITPLKTLQGLVWEAGYRNKAYQSHLYQELDAAQKAGLKTVQVCREQIISSVNHPTITTFDKIGMYL